MGKKSGMKRGIIRENDAKTGRSRVEFLDEDHTISHWLAWNVMATSGSKMFNQPDVGAQVNCLIDANGEDGIILGGRYSADDAPPTQNGSLIKIQLQGGADFEYDKASGIMTLHASSLQIIGDLTVNGNVTILGASLTHNGKNVGSTHGHSSSPPGPVGPPV
jgi:phage baseplate assembly protein gpV